jgi:peptide/nickel transport system ATP-binding protein
MQMIFQDPYASLDPRMSVGQIIMEPLKAHRVGKGRAERADMVRELMEQVGLRLEFFSRYPHQFSGGQRQRIGIARALALNPELIICDEPVSALDVSIQAQILNLMEDIQAKEGLTYIFITHDLSVVNHFADDIAVMYMGRMVEKAPSEQLFEKPIHPYTQALLSAIPIPDIHQQMKRIVLKGEVTSPIEPKPICRFAARCPYACEQCMHSEPELKEVEPDHWVACHVKG